jgi:hypothetical protein
LLSKLAILPLLAIILHRFLLLFRFCRLFVFEWKRSRSRGLLQLLVILVFVDIGEVRDVSELLGEWRSGSSHFH